MSKLSRKSLIAASLAAVVTIPAAAHIERTEPLQSLRQSFFAIVGMTFGPMSDMVKGEIEWKKSKYIGTKKKLLNMNYLNARGWKNKISLGKGLERVIKNH